MNKSHPQSVFLAYALADRPQVKKLLGRLKVMGVMRDSDEIIDHAKIIVEGSGTRREEVRNAINKADKLVVVWSKGGAESAWVNYETAMADALGKEIVVLVPKGQRSELPSLIAENAVLEMDSIH